ncbi:uncharacterized protein M421DRAFT_55363 [Didymella exigua CBS 183.55]|uniref:Xylanolytic transcriptional activator regulatory domain-containing protein n=1 Tax=Didymella exigua CBS 183.55 TaxID=1150837 RepID=A0A6A5RWH6_9PLEO|nr:uncharacterized protein M421DRAFT_55363 [Didymella exigua CBS 183.55]KAF1931943.1 hypothetical protein M421DRAFT_55363 [Didymella exigua CBS 183.55]
MERSDCSILRVGCIDPQLSPLLAASIHEDTTTLGFPGHSANYLNVPTNADSANLQTGAYESEWMIGTDFDVGAFNQSISEPISGWGHPVANGSAHYGGIFHAASAPHYSRSSDTVDQVQRLWYTRFCHNDTPGRAKNANQSHDGVDEAYIQDLSVQLRPPIGDSVLPSADFLNLCVKLFFVRFNTIFPLIHAGSFRPSSGNSLLLLSICSIGALFVGSTSAAAQGRKIFQALNKACLASWENYVGGDVQEMLALVQAATIGQTFGMLSGHSHDVYMTDCFHGTVIAWARQAGFFKIKDSMHTIKSGPHGSLSEAWKSWVCAEESIRLVLGLHVHDVELASRFHHGTMLRHTAQVLPVCCHEELFAASTASQWHALLTASEGSSATHLSPSEGLIQTSSSTLRSSYMHTYAFLSNVVASIQDARALSTLDADSVERIRASLLAWHRGYLAVPQDSQANSTSLMILWHAAFTALYADFDLLERAIGRDGHPPKKHSTSEVRKWAVSPEASRGVLHALSVLQHTEALPVSVEPAIHVPKALFSSAVLVYCCIHFSPTGHHRTPSQDDINSPEFPRPGSIGAASQRPPSAFPSADLSIVYNVMDLLRRIGHWEIARRLASIVEVLLFDMGSY